MPKRSSVAQTQALCHKPKLCATTKSKLSKNSAQPNNAFVSLQGKTLFIWQIKVAKTAKAKLCATTKSKLSKNSAPAEFLSFGTRQLHKLRVFRCQNEALCHKPKLCATSKALWHKPKLCATTQALCHKARHRGSRGALAHKNSLLTKRREPKPTNSACAEFANQNAGFILSPEFGFAEFLSFVPLQRKTQFL